MAIFLMLHKTGLHTKDMFMVTKDDREIVVHFVKDQCTCVVEGFIKELEKHFLTHDFMNANGIIHPHFGRHPM